MTAEPGAAEAPPGAHASSPAEQAVSASTRTEAVRWGDMARMMCLS